MLVLVTAIRAPLSVCLSVFPCFLPLLSLYSYMDIFFGDGRVLGGLVQANHLCQSICWVGVCRWEIGVEIAFLLEFAMWERRLWVWSAEYNEL